MKLSALAPPTIVVALAAFYFVAQQWPSFLVWSTDILFIAASGGTSLYAFMVVTELSDRSSSLPHLRVELRIVYGGLFLAVFMWFLGEVTWGIYEIILHVEIPYPSVADIFYLAGYVPAFISLFRFMWIFRRMVTLLRTVFAGIVGLAIIGLAFGFLLNPLFLSPSGILTKTFDLAYPILDAILLVLVTMILVGFAGTKLGRPWVWIFVGLLAYSFADILFSWGTLEGWYYSGHPIELLWLYAYLVLAIGFNLGRVELSNTAKTAQ